MCVYIIFILIEKIETIMHNFYQRYILQRCTKNITFQPFKRQSGSKMGRRNISSIFSHQNWISRQKICDVPDFQSAISKTVKDTAFAV